MPETKIESYWGTDFPEVGDSEPVALLKLQGDLLGEATAGKVWGVVEQSIREGTTWISLYLAAEGMGDFQFKILSIAHPAVVPDPAKPFPIMAQDSFNPRIEHIHNMEEFEAWLKGRLKSRQVRTTVGAMKHQAEVGSALAAARDAS